MSIQTKEQVSGSELCKQRVLELIEKDIGTVCKTNDKTRNLTLMIGLRSKILEIREEVYRERFSPDFDPQYFWNYGVTGEEVIAANQEAAQKAKQYEDLLLPFLQTGEQE